MQKLFLFFIAISFTSLGAQNVSISVNNQTAEKALLYSIEGEKTFLIDTIRSSAGNKFIYDFNGAKFHPGFYRLTITQGKWIDFIYDGENISLQTDFNSIIDSMRVLVSENNKLYYSFVALNKNYKIKSELLKLVIARYPENDSFYKEAQNKLNQLQNEYLLFVNKKSQKSSASFAARYISSSQFPVSGNKIPTEKQLLYLKSHALEKVDFKDSELIYSDLFASKCIEYLSYYRNPQLSKDQLEKEFTAAVDTLLNKAKVNQIVYQQITEYLINGFKQFGFDRIIDYIVANYVIKDDLCLGEKTEESIQRRIEQNKKLPLYSSAPDIILPDTSGRQIELRDIGSGNKLVIFYASWCPHCREIIPQINQFYKNQPHKDFKIFAISLDNKRNDWIDFIKTMDLDWINVSEIKRWESKSADDYFIYATPTMFLLDKNMKIIGKPLTLDELKQLL